MPYICLRTNATVSPERKEWIKSEFGRLISIIPGKVEAGLMVEIVDGATMYKAGSDETCAMVDVRCFKKAEDQDNKNFTEAALAMLSQELGTDPSRIYLSLMEFDTWGTSGAFKR